MHVESTQAPTCWRQQTTMRNPSIYIVALRHMKNRQTLQVAMLLLKNYLWATFQQQFQYSLTIKVLCNVDKFDTTAILRAYNSAQKQATDFFTSLPAIEI